MRRTSRKTGSRVAAFTLLEVLMVVAILGLLAGFVVTNIWRAREGAEETLVKAKVESGLQGALDRYRGDMGDYPSEDEGLIALIEEPEEDELAKRWLGPYVKGAKALLDVWGRDLEYAYPGKYNEDGYDLWSLGPKEDDDDDDIGNWDVED